MRSLPIEIQAVPVEQIKAEMKELNYPNLSASRKEFFKLLANWSEPSDKQVWWMRHLYGVALGLCEEAVMIDADSPKYVPSVPYITTAPVQTQVIKATYKPIFSLFEKASAKLKNPSINLKAENGKPVELKKAKPTSKNPGSIYVSDGGPWGNNVYYGAVTPEGEWKSKFGMDVEKLAPVEKLLAELAVDPVTVAAKYGKMTGKCCFCNKALTDPQSVAAGFGKVCAGNYGLLSEYQNA